MPLLSSLFHSLEEGSSHQKSAVEYEFSKALSRIISGRASNILGAEPLEICHDLLGYHGKVFRDAEKTYRCSDRTCLVLDLKTLL